MNDFNNAYDAYQAAVKAVRNQGVKIAQGLRGDGCSCGCSGWKTPAAWGDRDTLTNYAFTRSGNVKWDWNSSNSSAYWYWSGKEDGDLSTGYTLALTFASHGFDVDWNATTGDSVTVIIRSWDASKVGVVPDRLDADAFILEVLEVGTAMLAAREAYYEAEDNDSSRAVVDTAWREVLTIEDRVDNLKTSSWLVDWNSNHDAELRSHASSLSSRVTTDYQLEVISHLREYSASV